MNPHRWMIVMVGVLLVGAGVLMQDLATYEPLWVDEGWSIAAAEQGTLIDVTEFVAADVHPPLYFQILAVWDALTGRTIFGLRTLSVLIVLLSAALVYKLGRDVMNPYAGVLAALLFVLHDLIGVLGREVRQYPLTQFMAVLVMVLYWRAWIVQDLNPTRFPLSKLERGGKMLTTGLASGRGEVSEEKTHEARLRNRLIALMLGGAALLYTHYWGGFLLLALFIHAMLTQFSRIRHYIITFAAMGLLFAPWIPVVLNQISGEAEGGLGHALTSDRAGFDVLTFQLLGRPETLWLILLAVGAVGVYFQGKGRQFRLAGNPGLLPALAVIIPVGLSFIVNLAIPTLSFRALSMIIPAAVILIAVAVAGFRRYERVVVTVILVALSINLTAARPAVRLPWPPIADFVAAYSDDSDVVLIETDFDTYAYDYYLGLNNPDLTRLFTEVERRRKFDTFDAFAADLNESIRDKDGLWVTRYSSDADLLPTLEAAGWQRSAVVFWETAVGVPVETWRYDRPSDAVLTTYGDVLTLVSGSAQHIDNTVAISLLWSPEQMLAANYTVSAFLSDADGVLVAQNDSYPLEGRTATAGWTAENLYFDGHRLDVTDLAPGTYTVGVRVYTFTDETFSEIAVQMPSHCVDCNFYDLGTVTLGGGDD